MNHGDFELNAELQGRPAHEQMASRGAFRFSSYENLKVAEVILDAFSNVDAKGIDLALWPARVGRGRIAGRTFS